MGISAVRNYRRHYTGRSKKNELTLVVYISKQEKLKSNFPILDSDIHKNANRI